MEGRVDGRGVEGKEGFGVDRGIGCWWDEGKEEGWEGRKVMG